MDLTETGQDRYRKPTGEMFTRQEIKTRIKLLLPTDASLPALESEIVTDRHASGTRRLEDRGKVDESNLEEDVHTSEKQTITALPNQPSERYPRSRPPRPPLRGIRRQR